MKKLVFILLISLTISGCVETENGEKIVQIVGIKRSGIFFTTWEVTSIRGGIEGGTGTLGQSFHATVENVSIIGTPRGVVSTRGESPHGEAKPDALCIEL